MKTERFRLALRELKPSDWERFELLASIYLASEFPALRTLATLSGDSGRDGTFFAPEGDEIAFQYSISQDWRQKIRRTVERLNKQFPGSVRVLVYVSNCRIGADADEFKQELQREHGVHLDVRDENWFIERVNSNAERQEAAEELARVIVDPFLADEGVIARKAQALTGLEARTGLLYLSLQWKDASRDKGLTKLSYEALVKAALRGTSSTHRLTRQEVQNNVAAILPTQNHAALDLKITLGVVEEVERHLNRSMSCLHAQETWDGRTPFLLAMYAASGQPVSDFPHWTEQFAGTARPEDDIADFLREGFGIEVQSLEAEADNADVNLRGAVQEVWRAAHERRRGTVDSLTIARLISHDVENYVGVITRRNRERDSPFGYTSWWLSLDPTAFLVRKVLMDELGGRVPDSPVLSPDFLANYLAVGPMRQNVSKDAQKYLPVLLDLGVQEVPADLLTVANTVRRDAADHPEQLIRRKVRDEMDKAKRRQGPIAREGLSGLENHIKEQLAKNRRNRPPH